MLQIKSVVLINLSFINLVGYHFEKSLKKFVQKPLKIQKKEVIKISP